MSSTSSTTDEAQAEPDNSDNNLFSPPPNKDSDIGRIDFSNEQEIPVNIELLKEMVGKIRKAIGYPHYHVSLSLIGDEEMEFTNHMDRGVAEATDILSYQLHAASEPGVLEDPDFPDSEYYLLGDMMIDVAYVVRKIEEDREMLASGELDEYEKDFGVSGAMATVFDLDTRLHMLLVHGMLHLVGYDHERDSEYELMVKREKEVLKEVGLPWEPYEPKKRGENKDSKLAP